MLYGYFYKRYVNNFKFQALEVLAIDNTKLAYTNDYEFI